MPKPPHAASAALSWPLSGVCAPFGIHKIFVVAPIRSQSRIFGMLLHQHNAPDQVRFYRFVALGPIRLHPKPFATVVADHTLILAEQDPNLPVKTHRKMGEALLVLIVLIVQAEISIYYQCLATL